VLLATNWMPSCGPSFAAASRACRMDSGSGSRSTTSQFGNALAIATATRPTPQPDIENAAPILQSLDDLRELCEPIYGCAGPTYVLQSIGCAGCSITHSP
jgi:hypothetical protein